MQNSLIQKKNILLTFREFCLPPETIPFWGGGHLIVLRCQSSEFKVIWQMVQPSTVSFIQNITSKTSQTTSGLEDLLLEATNYLQNNMNWNWLDSLERNGSFWSMTDKFCTLLLSKTTIHCLQDFPSILGESENWTWDHLYFATVKSTADFELKSTLENNLFPSFLYIGKRREGFLVWDLAKIAV